MAQPGGDKNEQDKAQRAADALAEEQAEQREQAPSDELTNEPAEMAGLSRDQLGISATTNDPKDPASTAYRAQGPDAQTLGDTEKNEDNEYTFGPKANNEHYNNAMAGAGHTDTMYTQAKENKTKQEKEAQRSRATAALSGQIAAAYAAIDDSIGEMKEDVDEINQVYAQMEQEINQQISQMEEQRQEIEERLEEQRQELEELQEQYSQAGPGERDVLEQQIKGKEAQIENSEAVSELYGQRISLSRDQLAEAKRKVEDASDKLENLERQRDAAVMSGDPEGRLEDLQKQIEGTREEIRTTGEEMSQLQRQTEFQNNVLDTLSAPLADSTDYETLEARTQAARTLSEAIKDGQFTDSEVQDLHRLSEDLNLSAPQKQALAESMQKAQFDYVQKDGTVLSGANALEAFGTQWRSLEAEKKAELETTSNDREQAEAQAAQTQASIEANAATMEQADNTVNTLRAQASSRDDVASLENAERVVGENYTRATEVIRDKDGNEVHIDRSGDYNRYFHLDDEGNRNYYDDNDMQVANFENMRDGDAPAMSSISSAGQSTFLGSSSSALSTTQPSENFSEGFVKVFANDQINDEARLALSEKNLAEQDLQRNQVKLAEVTDRITALQERENILKADLQQLQDIKDAVQSGEMSEEQAMQALDQYQDDKETQSAIADTSDQDNWSADESVTYEAGDDYMRLNAKVDSQIEGSSIPKERLDEIIGDAPPELREKIESYLDRNNIEVIDPEENQPHLAQTNTSPVLDNDGHDLTNAAGVASNAMTFEMFGVTNTVQPIASPTSKPDPHNIQPSGLGSVGSFADSEAFSKYNDPNNPDATYTASINNRTNNVIPASERFGAALDNQPNQSSSMTAEQMERLRLEEEQRQQALLAQQQQNAQNDPNNPASPMGSSGGGMAS